MVKEKQRKDNLRKRRGQTLAEFALTLPILLLIVFGTIEFGRLFQAWVTIQNSAREATRYATTGSINTDIFDTSGTLLFDADGNVVDGDGNPTTYEPILPCLTGDQRGYPTAMIGENGGPSPFVFARTDDPVTFGGFNPARESIYAMFYDGANCFPDVQSDNDRRDILRVASIMMEARRASGGLAIRDDDRSSLSSMLDTDYFTTLSVEQQRAVLGYILMENWMTPKPSSDDARYFHVAICSEGRQFRNGASARVVDTVGGESNRFAWVREEGDDLTGYGYMNGGEPIFGRPFCLLNERQPDDAGTDGGKPPRQLEVDIDGDETPDITVPDWDNSGLPWQDAGGPGERIVVQVTYNHPLITPIGVAEYVTMRARRSGVNESFRASRALAAPLDPRSDELRPDTATPPPTFTPLPDTATPTLTATPTGTQTPTPTPPIAPFTCDDLGVEFNSANNRTGRVFLDIFNYHGDTLVAEEDMVRLERIDLVWNNTGGDSGMFVNSQFMDGVELLWFGENNTGDFTLAADANVSDLTDGDQETFVNANRTIPPLGPPPNEPTQWLGIFRNNNTPLTNSSLFSGTRFHFFDPVTSQTCVVPLDVPDTEPIPTEDPDNPIDPTATFTPNCATDTMSLRFVEFQEFGVVKLEITSNRYNPSPLRDFQINWPDPASLDPDATGIFKLDKIVFGGINADDYQGADAQGVLVWDGDDTTPATGPNDPSTVFWRNDYLLPPRTTLPIYLDFTGTGSTLPATFGIREWTFNNTYFDLGCTGGGGPGNGGGGSDGGPLFIATNTPPPPPNTPRPSNTPGPSATPTPTRPTSTPGPTSTPRPTQTDAPATPTEAPTFPGLPTAVPTDEGGGPAD